MKDSISYSSRRFLQVISYMLPLIFDKFKAHNTHQREINI